MFETHFQKLVADEQAKVKSALVKISPSDSVAIAKLQAKHETFEEVLAIFRKSARQDAGAEDGI